MMTSWIHVGSLHDWFVENEPSLMQSTQWTGWTPHVTILKVRSFGSNRSARGVASPGARVLDILRLQPQSSIDEESCSGLEGQHTEIEGEIIIYRGRPRYQGQINSVQQGPTGRKRDSYDQPVDMQKSFGTQIVDSMELLAMQGRETNDARGFGGYPVCGRVLLDTKEKVH